MLYKNPELSGVIKSGFEIAALKGLLIEMARQITIAGSKTIFFVHSRFIPLGYSESSSYFTYFNLEIGLLRYDPGPGSG